MSDQPIPTITKTITTTTTKNKIDKNLRPVLLLSFRISQPMTNNQTNTHTNKQTQDYSHLKPVLLLSFLISQPMTYPKITTCFSFDTIESRTMWVNTWDKISITTIPTPKIKVQYQIHWIPNNVGEDLKLYFNNYIINTYIVRELIALTLSTPEQCGWRPKIKAPY